MPDYSMKKSHPNLLYHRFSEIAREFLKKAKFSLVMRNIKNNCENAVAAGCNVIDFAL
jgi:ABC-type phosphonate transport system ATPase subunit